MNLEKVKTITNLFREKEKERQWLTAVPPGYDSGKKK